MSIYYCGFKVENYNKEQLKGWLMLSIKKTKFFLIIFIIIYMVSPLFSETQYEMNQQSRKELKTVELELEQIITDIKIMYKGDSNFLVAFDKQEILWTKYRDAYLKMIFPEEDKRFFYGSIYPVVYADRMTQITRMHIADIAIWLIGRDEGDLGYGSVKFKDNKINTSLVKK